MGEKEFVHVQMELNLRLVCHFILELMSGSSYTMLCSRIFGHYCYDGSIRSFHLKRPHDLFSVSYG